MSGTCNECYRAYQRKHYAKNKEAYRAKNQRHRHKKVELMRSLKMKPCKDCSREFHPCAMDFDHREGEIKLADVATLANNQASTKRLLAEIAKCDLLCAVCHRIRTFNRNAFMVQR